MSDTQPDEITLAVVAARLADVREDIKGMRADLTAHRAELVGRGEWEQRNHAVDRQFQEQGREIGQLRTTLDTKIAEVTGEIKAVDVRVEQFRPPRLSPLVVIGAVIAGLALLAPALSSLITLIDSVAQ